MTYGTPTNGPQLVDAVMALWNQGKDTRQMQVALGAHEAACERALNLGLDLRRGMALDLIAEAR